MTFTFTLAFVGGTLRLVATFIGVVATGILVVGYVFNTVL